MDNIAWTTEPEHYRVLVQNILDLTRILSPTTMEKEISDFCASELIRCGFHVDVDEYGNIRAVRGNEDTYVLLNAHMDVVPINKPTFNRAPKQEYYDTNSKLQSDLFMLRCKYVSEGHAHLKDDYGSYNDRLIFQDGFRELFKSEELKINEEIKKLRDFLYDHKDAWESVISNPWHPEYIQYDPDRSLIYSSEKGKDVVYVGGDDKAGVGIILTLAQITNLPFKVLPYRIRGVR